MAHSSNGIQKSQYKYTLHLLKEARLSKCQLAMTLIEVNQGLSLNENESPVDIGNY